MPCNWSKTSGSAAIMQMLIRDRYAPTYHCKQCKLRTATVSSQRLGPEAEAACSAFPQQPPLRHTGALEGLAAPETVWAKANCEFTRVPSASDSCSKIPVRTTRLARCRSFLTQGHEHTYFAGRVAIRFWTDLIAACTTRTSFMVAERSLSR